MALEADKQEAGVARSGKGWQEAGVARSEDNRSLGTRYCRTQLQSKGEALSSAEVLKGKAGAPPAEQLLAHSGFLVGTNSRA